MRRQTSTSGLAPAGSGRALRLDPFSLPLQFEARDARADGGIRHIELTSERVILRRAVRGMRMAVNIRVRDFLGIALRASDDDRQTLVLIHRDPSLTVPLLVTAEADEIGRLWQIWSDCLRLPMLGADDPATRGLASRDPASRRRRHNAIRARRPKFLVRRRRGRAIDGMQVYRGEREIIGEH